MRQTVLLPAAAPRCASGANCISYSTLGEPSKLSRANPGPRCFACEKQRADFEEGGVGAQQKAANHRQTKKPSHSEKSRAGGRALTWGDPGTSQSVGTHLRTWAAVGDSLERHTPHTQVVEIAPRRQGPSAVGRSGSCGVREERVVGAETVANKPRDDQGFEPLFTRVRGIRDSRNFAITEF